MNIINPGSTIGMLGGGQLGRMSTFAAKQMGYRLITLDPTPNSPCGQVADAQLTAAYTDSFALRALADQCDVITYEFENVPAESVELLVSLGKSVFPAAQVLKVTQNRLHEKTFAQQAGLAVADFCSISTRADLNAVAEQIGFPAMLKTVSGGYDGKGQFVLQTLADARDAFDSVGAVGLIWEKQVPFVKELSVICARNHAGAVAVYPATENIHVNNILDVSIAPARVSKKVQQEAQRIARVIAAELDLVGVCGVELFLLPDDSLLVNEIAPRPHNSGHYTIEACACSQFEQHIRAVCGLPLGSADLISRAVLVNFLGTGSGNSLAGVSDILQDPGVHFHLYGKAEAKANRKMGHITILGDDTDVLLEAALKAREKLVWSHKPGY